MDNSQKPSSDYEIFVSAKHAWFSFPWRELLEYRDLLFLLVRRDFVAKYKQTILGPIWFALQPLLQTVILALVLGHFGRTPTDGTPHFLFFLCAQLLWNYCSVSFGSIAATFINNAQLSMKAYFPRFIFPFSTIAVQALSVGINLVIFLFFWLGFRFLVPSGSALVMRLDLLPYFPLLLLQAAIIAMGFGLCLACLTTKYRDIVLTLPILTQIWMYLTILIPFSSIPEKWQFFVALNPMIFVTESMRLIFLGSGTVSWSLGLLSVGVSLVILLVGVCFFHQTERTFVDTI